MASDNNQRGQEYHFDEARQDWFPVSDSYANVGTSEDSSIRPADASAFRITHDEKYSPREVFGRDFLPPDSELDDESRADYAQAVQSAMVRNASETAQKGSGEGLRYVSNAIDRMVSDEAFQRVLNDPNDNAYESVDVSPTLAKALEHTFGVESDVLRAAIVHFKLSPLYLAAIETTLTGRKVEPKPTREQLASQRQRDIEAEVARRSERDLYGLNNDEEQEELDQLVEQSQQRKQDNYFISEAESFAEKYGLNSQQLDQLVAATVDAIKKLPNPAAKEKYSAPYGFGQALYAVYRSTGGTAKPQEQSKKQPSKPQTLADLAKSGKKVPISAIRRLGPGVLDANFEQFSRMERMGLVDYSR